ncbi:F-box/kelch-repeat protein At3g23880 [Medicago truncatula]|uniref:F-box protein interaction domain protein n=1 Tax=Medicago truncatula TaxID=3880 RepID=G7IWQ5_MEDTR|nr:F-box/kelch-repeat protein At3g23880 [Medicago truncatula]AES69468.1 F-box protein interaction domain protein [Medicago truncatula]
MTSKGVHNHQQPFMALLELDSSLVYTQLDCPDFLNNVNVCDLRVCSCNGILCFTIEDHFPLLWNPSIRRFNTFPPLKYPGKGNTFLASTFSFGYSPSTHNYKIVAVSFFKNQYRVSVYTLGTNTWRRIQDFPYSHISDNPGVFVSGTINWLSYDISSRLLNAIVSLDLENESYQNLLLPDTDKQRESLGKLRDCLCLFTSSSSDMLVEVWIMKEYGNKEPWTKLYNIPYMGDQVLYPYSKSCCYAISDDDQVLMDFEEFLTLKLFVYDSKNGTFNIPEFQHISSSYLNPEVYIESLISPYS